MYDQMCKLQPLQETKISPANHVEKVRDLKFAVSHFKKTILGVMFDVDKSTTCCSMKP